MEAIEELPEQKKEIIFQKLEVKELEKEPVSFTEMQSSDIAIHLQGVSIEIKQEVTPKTVQAVIALLQSLC